MSFLWLGCVAGSLLLVGLAVIPPWLPEATRWLLMQAFAPLCHQIPARSPTIDGVHLAVCDRCIGIYSGLAGGVVLAAALRATAVPIVKHLQHVRTLSWDRVLSVLRLALVGVLIPLAIDWLGPFVAEWTSLSGWTNSVESRFATGLLLGVVAGLLLIVVIANSRARTRAHPNEDVSSSEGTSTRRTTDADV
ncbi:hypothetical protein CRI94_05930 [Longibacter salinarum]|uniref:DUF2085 domain-containing protein n=2 Tax=Longibacter salinarum TaxID=1850348 RepID=A0A2A8D180_9BACT|nr:hypothetical protein CRI94_05930 [Longibacter salinarum]